MTKIIIMKAFGWLFTAMASFILLIVSSSKLLGTETIRVFYESQVSQYFKLIGFIEMIAAVLFIINKTSLLGVTIIGLIMSAAVAIKLSIYGEYDILPVIVWVTAWLGYILRTYKPQENNIKIFAK